MSIKINIINDTQGIKFLNEQINSLLNCEEFTFSKKESKAFNYSTPLTVMIDIFTPNATPIKNIKLQIV